MKTKKQDNTIITEEEKIAGQDQGGGVTERKNISTTKATNTPSPKVDYGTLDEDNIYNDETNIPPKVDVAPAPKVESKKPTFDMQTMINDLNAREEEALKKNEEERKKESRYHRARSIISAIGDGLSGLANIYFATKGAPDMLKGTTSLSAKQQERWDKIRKEREARREAYLKAVRDNNRESLKDAYTQWKDDRDYELKMKQEERLANKAKVDAMKQEAMALYYANKADKEGYLALTKAAEAQNMEEFLRLKNEVLESQAKKNNAQAANAGRSGGSGSRGVSKKGNEYIAWDGEGNQHYFSSAKAAEYFAKQEGTWENATRDTDKSWEKTSSTSRGGFPGRPSKIDGKGAKMPGVK